MKPPLSQSPAFDSNAVTYYCVTGVKMQDLNYLQEALGVKFRDMVLLEQALIHSSYVNENPAASPGHNERLEFLGDAVLGFFVAEKLYREFPGLDEGEMTRLRADLVRRDTLARLGRGIRLGDYLHMGKGEVSTGGRHKTANLAGALEAVIAAVYIDQGIDVAGQVVDRLLEREWEAAARRGAGVDYKSRLQEVTQARYQETPQYVLMGEVGPEHDKMFTVQVRVGAGVLGAGSGKSKKLAEMEAARAALKIIEEGFTERV
jgi:ribonuclease-3